MNQVEPFDRVGTQPVEDDENDTTNSSACAHAISAEVHEGEGSACRVRIVGRRCAGRVTAWDEAATDACERMSLTRDATDIRG